MWEICGSCPHICDISGNMLCGRSNGELWEDEERSLSTTHPLARVGAEEEEEHRSCCAACLLAAVEEQRGQMGKTASLLLYSLTHF